MDKLLAGTPDILSFTLFNTSFKELLIFYGSLKITPTVGQDYNDVGPGNIDTSRSVQKYTGGGGGDGG